MPSFYEFMMRHGECGVQAIIDRIVRYEGICFAETMTLEDRWAALMQAAPQSPVTA